MNKRPTPFTKVPDFILIAMSAYAMPAIQLRTLTWLILSTYGNKAPSGAPFPLDQIRISQREAARLSGIDSGNLGKALRLLIKAGAIIRTADGGPTEPATYRVNEDVGKWDYPFIGDRPSKGSEVESTSPQEPTKTASTETAESSHPEGEVNPTSPGGVRSNQPQGCGRIYRAGEVDGPRAGEVDSTSPKAQKTQVNQGPEPCSQIREIREKKRDLSQTLKADSPDTPPADPTPSTREISDSSPGRRAVKAANDYLLKAWNQVSLSVNDVASLDQFFESQTPEGDAIPVRFLLHLLILATKQTLAETAAKQADPAQRRYVTKQPVAATIAAARMLLSFELAKSPEPVPEKPRNLSEEWREQQRQLALSQTNPEETHQ